MKLGVKIFALVYGVLCIVSAVLQYNDPDPMMWIVIYTISALLSFGFVFNKFPFTILLIASLAAIAGGVYFFPEQFQGFEIGKGDIKNIEEGRESGGLFILGIVFLFFAIYKRFSKQSKI